MNPCTVRSSLAAICLAALPLASQAGRPLLVDDAGTNDKGHGHLEAWYERQPGGGYIWNLAPAFAVLDGIELSAAISRERPSEVSARALQLKVRLTEPQDQGCHLAASAAHSWLGQSRGDGNQFTGIATCNFGIGSAHLNVGALRSSLDYRNRSLVGAAFERPVGGAIAHVEWLREQDVKPIAAVGVRTAATKNLQVDASVARAERHTVFTVGSKLSF